VCDRERERKKESVCVCRVRHFSACALFGALVWVDGFVCKCVCVCVCEREREREKERKRECVCLSGCRVHLCCSVLQCVAVS